MFVKTKNAFYSRYPRLEISENSKKKSNEYKKL